jgi:SAM-dependent methyltransferase
MITKAAAGYCPCCEEKTWFISEKDWLRDNYICQRCKSIPRFRAIINRIKEYIGDISKKSVYEAAPGGSSSSWVQRNAGNYISSHFWDDIPLGGQKGTHYCQNMEQLTFEDNLFDLVVTQDVFEHIFEPEKAFREIHRVLKPGGYHIFTVPYYRGTNTTVRAKLEENGKIKYFKEPVYHGNPISQDGSLVTYDWGEDLTQLIFLWTGMITTIYLEKNEYYGLEAEFLEVFVSKKLKN